MKRLLLLLLLAGCVDDGLGLEDPNKVMEPGKTVEPEEGWSVRVAPSLRFGVGPIGQRLEKRLVITNDGTVATTISVRAISAPFVAESFEPELLPGQQLALPLVFVPEREGRHEGTLSLDLCAGGCPAEVILTGDGLTEDAEGFVCQSRVNITMPSLTCRVQTFHCFKRRSDSRGGPRDRCYRRQVDPRLLPACRS